ncbi:hypothetical protein TRFO_40786 [Tritrichomonas foetus]|uniref:Uncharacterized protein n=1 Tax=Tritrichomonas foetus TaxID=1144522 RepID=A0A1J4J6U7_9EUKA|nr:hypothetical protein TRFO_40786 [Tritrichomonas foetus]|eukprot:OHS92900.1 hypothetical protein TRFO_40786 [Tritrichomonas foetus]
MSNSITDEALIITDIIPGTKNTNKIAIIAGVLGSIAGVALISGLTCCLCCCKKNKEDSDDQVHLVSTKLINETGTTYTYTNMATYSEDDPFKADFDESDHPFEMVV